MKKIITIENKKIGFNQRVFTIAEIGSNHNRDKKTVFKLIDACAEAGFDCVKFQIYDPEEAFSKKCSQNVRTLPLNEPKTWSRLGDSNSGPTHYECVWTMRKIKDWLRLE